MHPPRAPRRWTPALVLLAACLAAPRPVATAAARPLDLRLLRAWLRREARRLASRYAPKRYPSPPAWALRKEPPLAKVAVLADSHYDDSGRIGWASPTRARLLKVIGYLNETIQPHAVAILGDIIADEHNPQQLRHVKALLDDKLQAPYLPVPGNHDGPGYDAVFGPRNYTRSVAGIRFVVLGITNWHWGGGWGNYDQLDWLRGQLAAHRREPTLVLIHNPICIPTFLNAGDVRKLLDSQPQVLGVLAGHMHADYVIHLAKPHFGMPMLIRPPYGFKVLHVHRDRIVMFTHEDAGGGYRRAPCYEKIDLPPPYRLGRELRRGRSAASDGASIGARGARGPASRSICHASGG